MLDLLAMTRIGANMYKFDVLPFGEVSAEDKQKLTRVDGLMGVVCQEDETAQDCLLGLGAPGVISRRHVKAISARDGTEYSSVSQV